MKKSLLILVALFSIVSAKAQSYLGYYHDNYAGVQTVLFNPASIADSRFKTDINLFSLSTAVGNDMYAVNFSDAFKSDYDFDSQAKKSFTSSNNAIMNLDLMGPAFMFNIAPKQTLAIYTRARAFVNLGGVNGELINEITKEDNKEDFTSLPLGNPNFIGNSWGEFGLSYAAVLYQKGQHFLKGGITAKYLQGVANAHFKGDGINLEYDENEITPGSSTYTSTGTATYGTSQDFENNPNIEIDSASKGFGLDLGLVYEWRPDFDTTKKDVSNFKELNKYKLRFGLSLTDLGSIKYEKGISKSYDLNTTVTQDDFDNAETFDAFLSDNYPETIINGTVKSKLPTAIHADLDWNMHKKFYLNVNGDFSMVSNKTLNQNSIENRFSVTPRYESRWLSFYVPVSFMQYSGAQMGAGLRTGIFFIGSGSVLSNTFAKESKSTDFHLGLKIPFYQKKIKDTDGDGVSDKKDDCPDVAGPIENKGCPSEDKVVDTDVLKKLNDFSKSILFDSGNSTIKQKSTSNLNEIVKVMNQYPSAKFELDGYTDNVGNAEDNLQLSKDRAAAVKVYLISKGISADRLSSEGYGIIKPIADNKTATGRALNRRVEIILMK
jgi:outer membrane protein OmpA-like peptidoglycan-associated protein